MDTAFLRTFIEVARLRHFGRAADALFITQSAVSARIRQLEDALGVALFTRKRNDIQVTAAGRRLLRHAQVIVDGWQRARQELALHEDLSGLISIGCTADLWPIMVRDWVGVIGRVQPHLALDVQAHAQSGLGERVLNGLLDIGVLFDPPQLSGLEIRELGQQRIALYASRPASTLDEALGEGYAYVDWGVNFNLAHARALGDRAPARLRFGQGVLALDQLLRHGGAAYLATALAEDACARGLLHVVDGAPAFERSVYAIHRVGHAEEALLRDLLKDLG